MPGPRYVCLDVEPGGKTTPVGAIGVCEVDANGTVGSPFHVRFLSPLCPQGEETDFPEVWAFIDAYIDGSIVAAYNARYDRAALRRLIGAVPHTAIQVPEIRCVLEAARRLPGLPSIGSLSDAVTRMKLFTEAERETRRRRFFDEHYGSKWLLNDASDDALACARLTTTLTTLSGLPPSELLSPVSPRLR